MTWIDAIVRYLVAPREAGPVKSRLIPKLLAALNAAPEKVMFPKGTRAKIGIVADVAEAAVLSGTIRSAGDGGSYNFVLPDIACWSVSSSADSNPAPAGSPRAMRVSVSNLSFRRSTR